VVKNRCLCSLVEKALYRKVSCLFVFVFIKLCKGYSFSYSILAMILCDSVILLNGPRCGVPCERRIV